jgi:hypothetical protein
MRGPAVANAPPTAHVRSDIELVPFEVAGRDDSARVEPRQERLDQLERDVRDDDVHGR